MEIQAIRIDKPEDANVILGQSHFIRTVEDLHEALVTSVPGIRFGVAFAESSGPCLVRRSGTDAALTDLAAHNVLAIGAGHVFLVVLGPGAFPIHVMRAVREVPEVCRIFCATANPVEVLVAETAQGRGVVGVVDGGRPVGIETERDAAARREFLRKIGLKL